MLSALHLNNYKCFGDHRIPLRPETIIVGSNNAGKSTTIEAFRLIGLTTERFGAVNFSRPPAWTGLPFRHRGMRPDLTGTGIRWENLVHQYGEPPASITGTFSNGAALDIRLGEGGRIHAVVLDPSGLPVQTKGQARAVEVPSLAVLPQVGPVNSEESILAPTYVRSHLSSYLAPSHFRNQLNLLYDEYFREFKRLVEATWPSLQIRELLGQGGWPGDDLQLIVRDGGFAAELAWMGHGLQMWLQVMWFVARTGGVDVVVLDEPDVYMHPDLQRQLLRFLRGRYDQLIVATHSTEILAEARPQDILIVNRSQTESRFATDLPAVQRVVSQIGSAQNLQLTRLWSAQKMVLVEGKDMRFLKVFQDLLFPYSPEPIDSLPHMPIGGWSGWPYAIGSAMTLRNAVDAEIVTYCILDSDYRTPEETDARLKEARLRGVRLHIWDRKEIENYLLNPELIAHALSCDLDDPTRPGTEEVLDLLRGIAENLRARASDRIAQEIHQQDRRQSVVSVNERAREILEAAWATDDGCLSIISGKEALSAVSSWSQATYGINLGIDKLLSRMRREHVHDEITEVITAIEERRDFTIVDTSAA